METALGFGSNKAPEKPKCCQRSRDVINVHNPFIYPAEKSHCKL